MDRACNQHNSMNTRTKSSEFEVLGKRGIRRKQGEIPISCPRDRDSRIVEERDLTSAKPRLSPCPARGCTVCAASPTSAILGLVYSSTCVNFNGNAAREPSSTLITRGGNIFSSSLNNDSLHWISVSISEESDSVAMYFRSIGLRR